MVFDSIYILLANMARTLKILMLYLLILLQTLYFAIATIVLAIPLGIPIKN